MEKLSELAGNPKNPRKITEQNAQFLKKSIERFGDLSGTTYNVRTKRLVTGHQRTNIIENLINEDPEIVWLEKFKKPTKNFTVGHGYIIVNGERFSIRFVDMDEETEAAANLVANSEFNQGTYDLELIPEIMDLADRSGLFNEMGLDLLLEEMHLDLGGSSGSDEEGEKEEEPPKENKIQLFYTPEEYQEMIALIDELKAYHDDANDSQTVIRSLRAAARNFREE